MIALLRGGSLEIRAPSINWHGMPGQIVTEIVNSVDWDRLGLALYLDEKGVGRFDSRAQAFDNPRALNHNRRMFGE